MAVVLKELDSGFGEGLVIPVVELHASLIYDELAVLDEVDTQVLLGVDTESTGDWDVGPDGIGAFPVLSVKNPVGEAVGKAAAETQNLSSLHPAGLAPGGAYSQGQEAERYGKGYTSSADGMCSNAWNRSLRRGGRSDNGLTPFTTTYPKETVLAILTATPWKRQIRQFTLSTFSPSRQSGTTAIYHLPGAGSKVTG